MEKYSLNYFEKLLASAEDDTGFERAFLYEVHLPWDDFSSFPHRFFIVRHVEESDELCWSRVFNDLRSALGKFGKEVRRKYRCAGKESLVYGPVKYCDGWSCYWDELVPYDPYEGKSYGPSNPWDAPGMKISDFIKGVI